MFIRLFTWSLLLTALAVAEPAVPAREFAWPNSYTPVRLIATPIGCSWRNGRPVAARADVARILHLPTDGEPDVDLIEVLSQQNWVVSLERDGCLVARPSTSIQAGPLVVRESDESRRAVATFAQLCVDEGLEWVKNDPRQALIDSIGQDIARQARRPVPWTFAIVRSREPNAACTGEGMVYVTTALLDLQLDRDEIAGILGHEVAHGARQQLLENRVERNKVQQTVQDVERTRAEYERTERQARQRYYEEMQNGASPGLAESNYRQQMESAQSRLKYKSMVLKDKLRQHQSFDQHKGHTDERQADLAGMKYAMAAGYQPDGLLRALQKLQARRFRRYGTVSMLGSRTHPPIGERIRALEQLLQRPEFRRAGSAW